MRFLLDPLLQLQGYKTILENSGKGPISVIGPSDSQKAHLVAALLAHTGKRGLFVAFNEMQAHRMQRDFELFFGDDLVFFPTREIVFFDVVARSVDSDRNRLKALEKIISGEYKLVITSIEALALKTFPPEYFLEHEIIIKNGWEVSLDHLSRRLTDGGYERVSAVDGKGHFAIRGGILDIYPVASDFPVRIEFFGDEVDSIRRFDLDSQRSIEVIEEVKIIPAAENQSQANGCLLDYLEDNLLVIDEPNRIEQRHENLLLEYDEDCKTMLEKGKLEKGYKSHYFRLGELDKRLYSKESILMNTLKNKSVVKGVKTQVSILSKQLGAYNGHYNLLAEDIKNWKSKGQSTVILAGLKGRGQRLHQTLIDYNVLVPFTEEPFLLQPGTAVITKGTLSKGFEYPELGLVVVAGNEFTSPEKERYRRRKKKPVHDAATITSFRELKVGDFVVHDLHGIGQYIGIEQVTVEGVTRDYLKIKYASEGFLYIPTNQLDFLLKYIGTGDRKPKLNKLGGSEWTRAKSRVKESLRQLAEELVQLYATRQTLKGYKYSPDTVWQRQFEEMFPFEETEDQLRCIDEIKGDMESDRPMDRLLCGDVGYGKTEVALRAMFKAVMDGRQVAFLCPTTVLCQQHYHNFLERFQDFPVKVEMLSRFRTQSETNKIYKDVKAGNIDVLVGTHKILGKGLEFKNLGLLVVDEEQRFGVKHKELIKELSPNIDVLTLTATPIPRTLHMSLTGIRDISLLKEPPEERYPVQTYVMEYDQGVINDAIMREIARKGQVFYLYNRVRGIKLKAAQLQKELPDVRFGIAHGQMNEKDLEEVIQGFINGIYDVLVCTTIIESGIDMPNVNTIIVENAEMLGLSQLYQIRGRVGRSNRLAYAYITYKKDKVLLEQAEKRLQAINEFTEFGSGFKIALRDLEIRGAGNLLGPEQHGHMDVVGYETYCRLLEEAVQEIKGEPPKEEKFETAIDINISAYIDARYIERESERIEMYRRISAIESEEDAIDVRDELVDRFGDIPKETFLLVEIGLIKGLAQQAGLSEVSVKGNKAFFKYESQSRFNVSAMGSLVETYGRRILVNASTTPYITLRLESPDEMKILAEVKELSRKLGDDSVK